MKPVVLYVELLQKIPQAIFMRFRLQNCPVIYMEFFIFVLDTAVCLELKNALVYACIPSSNFMKCMVSKYDFTFVLRNLQSQFSDEPNFG
jgi:hypothetical protein